MGKLEKYSAKKLRKTKLQEALLRVLFTNDKLSALAIIPEAINYLFDTNITDYPRRKEIIKSATSRLKQRGLIELINGHYSLTEDGKKVLREWEKNEYKINKTNAWDGKWRIIIFDIPETRSKLRYKTRVILKNAGFYRLQDSVWVIPYDCEDIINLMKTDLGLKKEILYIIADQIENDRYLKIEFDLLH